MRFSLEQGSGSFLGMVTRFSLEQGSGSFLGMVTRFSLEQGSGSFLGMVTTIWKLNVESEIIPLTGKHGSISGRCGPGECLMM